MKSERDDHLNRAFGLQNNVFFTQFKSYFMRTKTPAQKLHFPVSCLLNPPLNYNKSLSGVNVTGNVLEMCLVWVTFTQTSALNAILM